MKRNQLKTTGFIMEQVPVKGHVNKIGMYNGDFEQHSLIQKPTEYIVPWDKGDRVGYYELTRS